MNFLVFLGCGNPSLVAVPPPAPLLFRMPVEEVELLIPLVIGFDHDPDAYEGLMKAVCANYQGDAFPYCYDGHEGSDYELDGSFETMDSGSAWVIAAAAGIVINTADGNYDRCHTDFETLEVSCDGYPRKANFVELEHPDGTVTRYFHLMKDSVAVTEGEFVEEGARLGLIGSSGNSSAPHLHFGVQDSAGQALDPYGGPYSQPASWWCDQGADPTELPGACEQSPASAF